jgi:hypothetical protein
MSKRHPYCTVTGRVFDGGCSGVARLNGHPRCRIPALVAGAPSIQTESGWLRPERSLVYDNPTLLLHHAAATHPTVILTKAQLAGFSKTASRLIALLRSYPWANPQPLDWPDPELILFSTLNNPLLLDLITLKRQLQQAERLQLHTLSGSSFLAYRRC